MVFLWNSAFQPFGAEPDNSILSAAAVPSLEITTGPVLCLPASARADTSPSLPAIVNRGWPTTSSASCVLAVVSPELAVISMGKLQASSADGGRTLSISYLAAPDSIVSVGNYSVSLDHLYDAT